MLDETRVCADDLAARAAARRLIAQKFAHLDADRLEQLMAQVDLLAAAGFARHSDGRLDAGALAEAARLAVIVAAARSAPATAPAF